MQSFLIFYLAIRTLSIAFEQGHRATSHIYHRIPPIYLVPFALDEAIAAHENAQTGGGFRARHYSGSQRPHWHQELEGAARWNRRDRERVGRGKEGRRSLQTQLKLLKKSLFIAKKSER